jgi:hypothetical protein
MYRRYVLVLCGLLALQCGHGKSLSREEMAKLDPGLQQLFAAQPPADAPYDVTVRSNGVKEYGVVIRSSSPQALRDAGIQVGSVFGDVVTARVSVDELRHVVSLPSVRAVEQGARSEIH